MRRCIAALAAQTRPLICACLYRYCIRVDCLIGYPRRQCADAFLYNDFGSGWEWWPDFDKFHQIAIDELNAFNYEEYKANGFKVKHLGDCHCELYDRPECFSSVPLMCKR